MGSVAPPVLHKIDHVAGTDREVFITWTWTRSNTDHFEVWWEYTTKNGVWFTGSESSEKHAISSYSYPENATSVRVRVKPVAENKSGGDTPYWTSNYSKTVSYTVKATSNVKGRETGRVSNLEIILESGTDRTLHATWTFSEARVEHYSVEWQYYTANKRWFYGSIEEVTVKESTFNAPANALYARVRVLPVSEVAYETDVTIAYYWIAKVSAWKKHAFPADTAPPASGAATKLRIDLQNGTERTLYATWSWSKSNTDHYEITWQYYTGDKDSSGNAVWFDGSTSSVTVKNALYTAPDNARQVRCRVLPIAKEVNGRAKWTARSTNFAKYTGLIPRDLSAKKAYNLKVQAENKNTTTLIGSWSWDSKTHSTDHYQVEWSYTAGNKDKTGVTIWIVGSETTSTTKNSTYSFPSNAKTVRLRVKPIAVNNAWVCSWNSINFTVPVPSTKITKLTKTVTNVDIEVQDGTDRTLFAVWDWDDSDGKTKGYSVVWQWTTGQGTWFAGSSEEVTLRNSLYSAQDNATRVRVKIKPIAKTHKVNNVDTAYYTADWCSLVYFNIATEGSKEPAQAPTPAVDLDNLKLTAQVDTYDDNTKAIEFEIVKNDETKVFTGRSKVVTNHAAISYTVAIGGEYKVRARGLYLLESTSLNELVANAATAKAQAGEWSEYSSNVCTRPATPSAITSHVCMSSSMVKIEWTSVDNVTGYKIEYATDSSYFDVSGMVTSIDPAGSYASRIISGLNPGYTYFFRVRAVNDSGESGWTPIYSLVLGTKPSPPTTWSDTTTSVIGDKLYLYWTHNSEDDSTQSGAEVYLNVNGEDFMVEPTYMSIDGTPSYYVFDSLRRDFDTITDDSDDAILDSNNNEILSQSIGRYPEGSVVRWSVRTKGVTNEWSEWSTERVFIVYAQPVVELYVGNNEERNDNAYEINHYPLLIHAEVFPEVQQAIGYNVSIIANEAYETVDFSGNSISIRDQETVFSKYITAESNTLDLSLTAGDVNLDNDITYTVSVTVGMDSSLTAESSWTFTARWDVDVFVPDAEVTINKDDLCAYIRPFCNDENDELMDDVLMSVYRIEYDGRLQELATGLPNGEITIVDPHPSLNYARYRIVAMDDSTGEIGFRNLPPQIVGETGIVIQWNETWQNFFTDDGEDEDELAVPVKTGSTLKLPYNVEVSDSNSIDVALNEYIGRSHPVSYYGTQLGVNGTWNAVILANDLERIYALRRLAIYRGDVYVREPSGAGYWANINVSFSKKYSDMTIPVTLNVTRVEGGI